MGERDCGDITARDGGVLGDEDLRTNLTMSIYRDGHAWDKFGGQAVIRLFFLELNLTQTQFKGDLSAREW